MSEKSTLQKLGENVVKGTDDIIAKQSNLIHKWVAEKSLPYLGSLAFYFSYYQLSFVQEKPVTTLGWLWGTMYLVIAFGLIQPLKAGSWSAILSGYRATMFYIATLLLIEEFSEIYSPAYWGFATIYYWFFTWSYRQSYLMPGEFLGATLLLAALISNGVPLISSFAYIFIAFVPSLGLLYWPEHRVKAMLLLIGVMLLVWLGSDIDGMQKAIAVIATLGFIVVAVFALKKLTRDDTSNLVYSFALGIISGLVLFVLAVVLQIDLEKAGGWWLMSLFFAGISIYLFKKCSRNIYPVLILWNGFWSTITIGVTWGE
ncbi:MAG: hypothetical protein OQK04_03690, partial [Kangiellaceae bacterium]|nr:hypothetical protein [Kangiellaceae bacterium]